MRHCWCTWLKTGLKQNNIMSLMKHEYCVCHPRCISPTICYWLKMAKSKARKEHTVYPFHSVEDQRVENIIPICMLLLLRLLLTKENEWVLHIVFPMVNLLLVLNHVLWLHRCCVTFWFVLECTITTLCLWINPTTHPHTWNCYPRHTHYTVEASSSSKLSTLTNCYYSCLCR